MEVDLSLVKMCILHVCVYLLQDPYGSSSYIPVLPYGVEIPNRVFVGGISYSTTELELKEFFGQFGHVKDSKIITDRSGVSKGYGFITFATEEEAVKVYTKVGEIQMASHIVFSYCVHAFSYITCGCQAFYCGTFSLYVSGSVGYIRLRKQFSRP